jgi:hypothetical protein
MNSFAAAVYDRRHFPGNLKIVALTERRRTRFAEVSIEQFNALSS